MFTELDDIKQITQTEESVCECKTCINMCHISPCIGTPSDILAIMKAGYDSALVMTKWAAGVKQGIPPITMIQPYYDGGRGCCVFMDETKKKCILHDEGLKPTEGRLQNHALGNLGVKMGINLPVGHAVALTWTDDKNMPIVMEMVNTLKEARSKDEK